MIIASPAEKELAIQLQVLQTPTTTSNADTICFSHEYCSNPDDQDIVTVSRREIGTATDFVGTVFARWTKSVEEHMVISTTTHETSRPVQCEAFIHDDTVFLTCPVMDRLSSWADGEFQSCVTHLIELAEEKTGCEYLVIAIDRRHLDNNTVIRAFMYLGFQMIEPSVYGQEPGFILVGYEL